MTPPTQATTDAERIAEIKASVYSLRFHANTEGWFRQFMGSDVPWLLSTLSSALSKVEELTGDVERLRAALQDIADAHVPDQPAADGADERTYVMQHVGRLRGMAMCTLQPELASVTAERDVLTRPMAPADEEARKLFDAWNAMVSETGAGLHHSDETALLVKKIAAALARAISQRDEHWVKLVGRYIDTPLGDEINNTAEAHANGMTYSQGSEDTAAAILDAIRKGVALSTTETVEGKSP